ncbi:MAG TPA: histidine kinase dimerization/phospho-acceptor domain-containing protein, partial [Fibrella sp.]
MHSAALSSEYPFLAGGGEMGELIRGYDWQQTPLGPPRQWPQSLRSMVSLVLKSKFPIMLFWGAGFIQLYNDAYRPSLGQDGKHPRALGQGGPECWPEIWHAFAQPLFDQIASTRESILSEDQLVPIYRNGKEEEAYWTYTYLPVIDEEGQVGGILAIVHETTQKVKTVLALQQSTTDLERSNANLQLFASAASHDLQEPLRKIQQFSGLLINDYESRLEGGVDYVKRIQLAAGRMSTLIRDLLTLSQVTTPPQLNSLVPLDDCVQGV